MVKPTLLIIMVLLLGILLFPSAIATQLTTAIPQNQQAVTNTAITNIFFTFSGWLVGVITLIISIIWREYDKKKAVIKDKREAYIMEHVDKKILAHDLKKEIDELDMKKAQVTSYINNELPQQAQSIALRAILENEINNLGASYRRVMEIRAQIKDDNTFQGEDLFADVVKQIGPTYSMNRKRNAAIVFYIILTMLDTFLSSLSEFTYIVIFLKPIFLLTQIIIISSLLLSTIKVEYTKQEIAAIAKKSIHSLLWIASIIILSSCITMFGMAISNIGDIDFLLMATLITYTIYCIYPIYQVFKVGSTRQKYLWVIVASTSLFSAIIVIFITNIAVLVIVWSILLMINLYLLIDTACRIFFRPQKNRIVKI
jgi:hypothetical protein